MATAGGSGGGPGRRGGGPGSGGGPGGGGDGAVDDDSPPRADARFDWEADPEPILSLPPLSRPREDWEKAWTSAGSTSSFDPMSHYVRDKG